MKISNSKIDLYDRCPRAFYYKYIENLKADKTNSPLLFGIALDISLNYILESIRDKKEWTRERALEIFGDSMEEWKGQNRLDFFKGDVPKELQDKIDEEDPDFQEQVWEEMYKRGIACIDVYIKEILPQFKEIIDVQIKFEIPNKNGDVFNGVIDFIAKMQDDRVVLFDNKTSSARYPKTKVKKSQQLSLYLEQFPDIKYAGYCVLIKNPEKERGVTYQLMVDEIPEETTEASYKKLDETLNKIAAGEFPCNPKGCKAFGKPCEYEMYCNYGDKTGLIPNYTRKKIDDN